MFVGYLPHTFNQIEKIQTILNRWEPHRSREGGMPGEGEWNLWRDQTNRRKDEVNQWEQASWRDDVDQWANWRDGKRWRFNLCCCLSPALVSSQQAVIIQIFQGKITYFQGQGRFLKLSDVSCSLLQQAVPTYVALFKLFWARLDKTIISFWNI